MGLKDFFAKSKQKKEEKRQKYIEELIQEQKKKDALEKAWNRDPEEDFDKYNAAVERFEEKLDDFEEVFTESLSYTKRVRLLENLFEKYSQLEELAATCYGSDGSKTLKWDLEYYYEEIPYEWRRCGECEHTYGDEFSYEQLTNIPFLKALLKEYKESPEEIKKHLENLKWVQKFWDSGCETKEEFMELLAWEKELKKFKSELKAFLKKNDGILQKDIWKNFDPKYEPHIGKLINELIAEGFVAKEKEGRFNKIVLVKKC